MLVRKVLHRAGVVLLPFLLLLCPIIAHAETWHFLSSSSWFFGQPQDTCAFRSGGLGPVPGTGGYIDGGIYRNGQFYLLEQFLTDTNAYYKIVPGYGGQTYLCGVLRSYDYQADPAFCADGVQSGDEIGADCGGSCSAACVSKHKCADGDDLVFSMPPPPEPVRYECIHTIQADVFGNCPKGYGRGSIDPQGRVTCIKNYDAASFLGSNELADQWSATFIVDSPIGWTGGTLSIVDSSTTVENLDNGDGTSTITTTTTTINSDGSTTTNRNVSVINNSTNQVITQTETITKQNPNDTPAEDGFDYDFTGKDLDITGMELTEEDKPERVELTTILDGIKDSTGGLFDAIKSSGIETSAPVCKVEASILGAPIDFDFCDTRISNFLSVLKLYILFHASLLAYTIIGGRD